jgi:hypothetical protein
MVKGKAEVESLALSALAWDTTEVVCAVEVFSLTEQPDSVMTILARITDNIFLYIVE